MDRSAEKRRRCSSSPSPSPLPLDIIELEILPRLPVKSLLRFKSVCQSWYSVITSPNFASTRYNHPSNRIPPLIYDASGHQQITVRPYPDNDEKGGNFLFSYNVVMPRHGIFLRPVNGFLLILLANRKITRSRMALYNPATRQFRFLIDFELDNRKNGKLSNHVFGYGVCKDLYKVVWLCRQRRKKLVTARVYTIGDGDGGWRVINAALPASFVENYTNTPNVNVFMNGKCYWLSRDLAHILIFDMDMDEEVFREMESPISTVYGMYVNSAYVYAYEMLLTEVPCSGGSGNSLALFRFQSEFVDVSVMDNEEEWHWIHRIVTYICRPVRDFLSPLLELRFPLADSILFKHRDDSFALYNASTNRCERFGGIRSFWSEKRLVSYFFTQAFNLKESFFSVDGGIQVSESVLQDFCTF